jgi:large subunit ribosomal protein L22
MRRRLLQHLNTAASHRPLLTSFPFRLKRLSSFHPALSSPDTAFSRSVFSWGKRNNVGNEKMTQPHPPPEQPTAADAAPVDPLRALTSSIVPSSTSSLYPNPANPEPLPLPPLFISRATRSTSIAHHRNIQIAPTKLNDICRLIRGLNVSEAIIQCSLCPKKKAVFVANCIRNAATAGVHNFQMDRDRLYVAEAVVGHGAHRKAIDWKGRGKTGIKRTYFSHLTIKLREQPTLLGLGEKLPGMWGVQTKATGGSSHRGGLEVRVGRVGRKIATVERQREKLRMYAEEKRRRGQKVPLELERIRAVIIRP